MSSYRSGATWSVSRIFGDAELLTDSVVMDGEFFNILENPEEDSLMVLRSADFGESWQFQHRIIVPSDPEATTLYHNSEMKVTVLYSIVGRLWVSRDGMKSFQVLPAPKCNDFNVYVYVTPSGRIVINVAMTCGTLVKVYSTTDTTDKWIILGIQGKKKDFVTFRGKLYALQPSAEEKYHLVVSVDNGMTWKVLTYELSPTSLVYDTYFQRLVCLTYAGLVDSFDGIEWNNICPRYSALEGVCDYEGLIAMPNGDILHVTADYDEICTVATFKNAKKLKARHESILMHILLTKRIPRSIALNLILPFVLPKLQ